MAQDTVDERREQEHERDQALPPDVRPIRMPRLLVAFSEFGWRFLVCIAAAAALVYGLAQVALAVIPVFIALLLSTLLVPPARALRARGVGDGLSSAIVFIGFLLAFAGVIAVIAPSVSAEFEELPDRLREGADRFGDILAGAPFNLDPAEVDRQIDTIDDRITDTLSENQGAITSQVVSAGQFAATLFTELVITLFVLFFFVKDGGKMWRGLLGLFPEPRREPLRQMGDVGWHVLGAYVRGVAFVATFDAVAIAIALVLIGVPLVLPLAVITFFAAFVPLAGAIVAGIIAGLVALAFEGPTAMLLVGLAILVIQQLEGNFIYPLVVGRTVELHPVTIILAVTVGAILFGIIGAAIAVPVAAVLTGTIKVLRRTTESASVAVGPGADTAVAHAMDLRTRMRELAALRRRRPAGARSADLPPEPRDPRDPRDPRG